MGLRDLIFGKEEEEEEPKVPETKAKPLARENRSPEPPAYASIPGIDEPEEMEVQRVPVAPVRSEEFAATLKELQDLMQHEKKDKGLGTEYYGFLKALGQEDSDEAHQRTLRSVNAVREQFAIGQALTWKSLVESAKACMAWLGSHSRDKINALQNDYRAAAANHTLKAEKAAMAIQEAEEKIRQLQRQIEEQKAVQQSAKDAQKKAELEFERKKVAIDNASVELATDIANDIAVFQRQQ